MKSITLKFVLACADAAQARKEESWSCGDCMYHVLTPESVRIGVSETAAAWRLTLTQPQLDLVHELVESLNVNHWAEVQDWFYHICKAEPKGGPQ